MFTESIDGYSGLTRAVIALGSNLGDRLANLQSGVDYLRDTPDITIISVSRVYETRPLGEKLKGDFFNAALACDTSLDPQELLDVCFDAEARCGRDRLSERDKRSRDRCLDLDIIFFGDIQMSEGNLIIPHQEWKNRPFVINPLLDLLDSLSPWQKSEVLKASRAGEADITVIDQILEL